MQKFITYFTLLLFFALFYTSASADCHRHIYNYSSKPWTFEFFPYYGKPVGIKGADCVTAKACTIPAGQSVSIYYNDSQGTVRITDFRSGQRNFMYSSSSSGKCSHIVKEDSSKVLVNNPARGDIKVTKGADNW